MLLLHNPVRQYAWGSVDGLAAIVGSPPSGGPEAELWIGTHPSAPSLVADDPDGRTLADVIASDPSRWLGEDLASSGVTALPFLLKVLAIGAPLSLQAHPSTSQARAGFDREEAAGLRPGADRRSYVDPGPKPESLVALTTTMALCGFRDPRDSADLVAELGIDLLVPLVAFLRGAGGSGHRSAMAWLLRLDEVTRLEVSEAIAAAVARRPRVGQSSDPIDPWRWVAELVVGFPGDPTCLAPLLLHVVRLAAGEALHLPAGNLHAYLHGSGVEIMAASDNVLRGGLTAKHVDVDELLAVLQFEPGRPPAPVFKNLGTGLSSYDSGEHAYALAVVDSSAGPVLIDPAGPSLLLATGGCVDVAGPEGGLTIDGGDAIFVAPGEGPLVITGSGRLWWATIGDALPD